MILPTFGLESSLKHELEQSREASDAGIVVVAPIVLVETRTRKRGLK